MKKGNIMAGVHEIEGLLKDCRRKLNIAVENEMVDGTFGKTTPQGLIVPRSISVVSRRYVHYRWKCGAKIAHGGVGGIIYYIYIVYAGAVERAETSRQFIEIGMVCDYGDVHARSISMLTGQWSEPVISG